MSTLKTGKVKTTTIADELDTESTAVTNVINGSAKAWVNFNGTGAVAIRRSFNVTSIVDNGTGSTTINFTNSFTDTNYAIVATSNLGLGNAGRVPVAPFSTLTTSAVGVYSFRTDNLTAADCAYFSVAIFS